MVEMEEEETVDAAMALGDEEFGLTPRAEVILLLLIIIVVAATFAYTVPDTLAVGKPEGGGDGGGDIEVPMAGGSTSAPAPTAAADSGSQVETAGDRTATTAAAIT